MEGKLGLWPVCPYAVTSDKVRGLMCLGDSIYEMVIIMVLGTRAAVRIRWVNSLRVFRTKPGELGELVVTW